MRQLTDLLAARDLTTDELGLLYCYKHGVSTNQALKTIGSEAKCAITHSASTCQHYNRVGTPSKRIRTRFCILYAFGGFLFSLKGVNCAFSSSLE